LFYRVADRCGFVHFETASECELKELLGGIVCVELVCASQLSGERTEWNDVRRSYEPNIINLLLEGFLDVFRQIRTVQEIVQVFEKMSMPKDGLAPFLRY